MATKVPDLGEDRSGREIQKHRPAPNEQRQAYRPTRSNRIRQPQKCSQPDQGNSHSATVELEPSANENGYEPPCHQTNQRRPGKPLAFLLLLLKRSIFHYFGTFKQMSQRSQRTAVNQPTKTNQPTREIKRLRLRRSKYSGVSTAVDPHASFR